MKVLVCGGRDYQHRHHVWCVLDAITPRPTVIIHGSATGADEWAHLWAHNHGIRIETFKPDWGRYGREAGPIRNRRMIDEGKPDLVLAFPGGIGTADMVSKAVDTGIPVRKETR